MRVRVEDIAQLVSNTNPREMGINCPDGAVMFESPGQQLKGMRDMRVSAVEKFHDIKISGTREPPQLLKSYPAEELEKITFPYDDTCAVITHPFKNVVVPEDDQITADIMRAVRRPVFIGDIVAEFVSSKWGERKFAGLFYTVFNPFLPV